MSRTTIPTCRIGPNNRLISMLLRKTRNSRPANRGTTCRVWSRATGSCGMDHDRYCAADEKPGSRAPCPAHPLRLSALCAVLRHVPARLSADRRRARVHAAAGHPGRRRLSSRELGGPARRREHPAGHARKNSPGPTRFSSAACMSRNRRSSASPARARDAGKPSVLGGPSVSACPEEYPEFDYLHIGEIGDATDALIARARRGRRRRPRRSAALSPPSACRSPISRSRPID